MSSASSRASSRSADHGPCPPLSLSTTCIRQSSAMSVGETLVVLGPPIGERRSERVERRRLLVELHQRGGRTAVVGASGKGAETHVSVPLVEAGWLITTVPAIQSWRARR